MGGKGAEKAQSQGMVYKVSLDILYIGRGRPVGIGQVHGRALCSRKPSSVPRWAPTCTHSPASALLILRFRPFTFTLPWLSTFRTHAPDGYSKRGGLGS